MRATTFERLLCWRSSRICRRRDRTDRGRAAPAAPKRPRRGGFASIRDDPLALLAFLREMPKGGDLHNHLSGAIYAESYLRWAAEDSCASRRRR